MKRGVLALLLLLTSGPVLLAADNDRVQGISERVFKVIGEAQAFIDSGDYATARAGLEDALTRRTTNSERAQLLNMLGYAWYEADDLERARSTYREALAIDGLPDSLRINLNLTLGQVHLVDEQYADAERHLRTLLSFDGQDTPSNRILLAAALLGQERYSDALPPLGSAIAETEQAGEVPRENWLSMLSSVYYELNDYVAMRAVVEKLTLLYPREQYLMNLAALHGQLGDTERQLALVEALLDDQRLHQPTHLRMIVNLYLGAGLPHKAATVIERELEQGRIERTVGNLELLSQAWYMSADVDRAIAPLAEAAALSESGELSLRLARLHMDAERWLEAEAAAASALDKGGLRQAGQAWLLRGMADVRRGHFDEARRHFQRAAGFNDTERYATQWLAYLEAEAARVAVVRGADR